MTIADWFRSDSAAATPVDSPAFNLMCMARPGQFDHLTVHIQAALIDKGAKITANGVWTDETCKEWWRIMDEPLSVAAITALRPDLKNCPAMLLPQCKRPGVTLERVLQIAIVLGIAYGGYRAFEAYRK
jgi:hypothetical protein